MTNLANYQKERLRRVLVAPRFRALIGRSGDVTYSHGPSGVFYDANTSSLELTPPTIKLS